MHYIFYDFETSGTDLLDQILSFAFVSTNTAYLAEETLTGTLKPNPILWPRPQALFTNKLDINFLQREGLAEWQAADILYGFIDKHVKKHKKIALVGYNSSQFDWEFLKSLFIRYGLSPYFMGKIIHIDLLYVVRHWYYAHHAEQKLPIKISTRGDYYTSMTLEDVCQSLGLLTTEQDHEALSDVSLCLSLAKTLKKKWAIHLDKQHYHTVGTATLWHPYRQKVIGFSSTPYPEKPYTWKYWIPLAQEKNGGLVLDLEKWHLQGYKNPKLAVTYTNQTRHDFLLEPLSMTPLPTPYQDAFQSALNTPELLTMTMASYFESRPNWDIAYQLHELGFKRIDTLRYYIQRMIQDPNTHSEIVTHLWHTRKEDKDTYLIQLLNRAYLSIHPTPKETHLKKYLHTRYVAGTMYRNPADKPDFDADMAFAQNHDTGCMRSLLAYYAGFRKRFGI